MHLGCSFGPAVRRRGWWPVGDVLNNGDECRALGPYPGGIIVGEAAIFWEDWSLDAG
jgi:hypothetical protein